MTPTHKRRDGQDKKKEELKKETKNKESRKKEATPP